MNWASGGIRIAWFALVSAGILQKLLLLHRPYERMKGDTDKVYKDALQDLCASIECAPPARNGSKRYCPRCFAVGTVSALFR